MMLLLASVTGVYAEGEGALSIQNIRNVIPNYSGSFDIVLSDADVTYCAFQFDIAMPAGLDYTTYVNGSLLSDHTVSVTDHTTYKTFIVESASVANFSATNGTLLTIKFTVDQNASGTPSGSLSNIVMSDANNTGYNLSAIEYSVPVGNTLTLDENDASLPTIDHNVDVIVKRSLKAGVWNTLVLPFPMTSAQISSAFDAYGGIQIAELSSVVSDGVYDDDVEKYFGSSIQVNFTNVTEMAAHRPYIVKVASSITDFSVSDVTITSPPENFYYRVGSGKDRGWFYGNYNSPMTISKNDVFITDNQFKYSTGNSKLKGYRGYFRFNTILTDKTLSSSTRGISFSIDETTGLNDVRNQKVEVRGEVFNLQGQRVAQPTKGVYIVNGRKVVFK